MQCILGDIAPHWSARKRGAVRAACVDHERVLRWPDFTPQGWSRILRGRLHRIRRPPLLDAYVNFSLEPELRFFLKTLQTLLKTCSMRFE